MKNKTPIKIASGVALLALMIATTFYACKKELKEDQNNSKQNPSSASIGNSEAYSEQNISDFIDDVKYYKAKPDESKYVESSHAINLMEDILNYQYSDIDTPFAQVLTNADFMFNLPTNDQGQYNMHDVAIKIYEIKTYILQLLAADHGSDVSPRMMLCSIDNTTDGSGGYKITFYVGDAVKNPTVPPSPNPPTVSSTGAYEWGTGFKTNGAYSCSTSSAHTIQELGSDYLKSMVNYYISNSFGYTSKWIDTYSVFPKW